MGACLSCRIRLLLSILSAPNVFHGIEAQAQPPREARADSLIAVWTGSITANGRTIPLLLSVKADSAGVPFGLLTAHDIAFVRSPTLGPIRRSGANLRFSAGLSEGSLVFTGTLDEKRITGRVIEVGMLNGQWKSVGDTVPFVLERGGNGQEPEALPYELRDTTFVSGSTRMSGTLFVPRGAPGRSPGMVFVHGSGPATRDEGNFLADHFARRGFVALVYDKRGAGRSGGSWITASVPDLAADALAAVSFLGRTGMVDRSKVGLAGMSQGGWVVINAASRSEDVRFIALQAGPVLPPSVNNLWRFKQRLGRAGITGSDSVRALSFLSRDAAVSASRTGYAELVRDTELVKDSAWFKALGWGPSPFDDEYRAWSAKISSYDPAEDLRRIRVPALWIYGSADLAVDSRTEAAAACEARGAFAGLRHVVLLEEADHGMRIDQPLQRKFPHVHPGFFRTLDQWLDGAVSNVANAAPATTCPAVH